MRTHEIITWIGALLLGALAPALVVIALMATDLFPFALAITLGHAIILGLPAALLYRSRHWARLSAALVGGIMIGIIPGAIVLRPGGAPGTWASVGDVATIINGVPTTAAWMQYLEFLSLLGTCGAIGAAVFWSTLRVFGMLKLPDPEPPHRELV